ncbi:hypothetical protein ACJMK2_027935 [Sinanodonta woodiana]|uniref:Uncharacterized protein n=1 Tax=Sinanodonta woodiana TaxID=1069815 RepID=A0ABD3X9F0_SINWO
MFTFKDQPGIEEKSKDELVQTFKWLETLHQRIKIEMCHEGQGDSSTDCAPISRDTIDNDVSKLLERKQELEENIKQLKLLEVAQSGKSQGMIHDVYQEELAETHGQLEHQNHRQHFEMVLDGPAEFIMDCSQVSRDGIDADKSNLVEIKDHLEEKVQQFNQLMESEVTPSGKSQTGSGDRDQEELHPKHSFESIIPVISIKCEGDNDMDFSSVIPHDNCISVVLPRQQPMEGKIEQLGQLNQAEETTANKNFVCITMEQKSKPEYGLAQLEIQVTATKVEPSKKTPLEHKNKRHLKPHGPVFFMDKRQVPQLETPKETQTRPHQPPLKRRTTKPKTKTQR